MERRRNVKGKDSSSSMENGQTMKSSSSGSLKGDGKNIALLFFLYTLQGIPLGLSAAIPMILQNRGVSYKQQAEFSFVNWPFSIKLLWAPIVDSMFSMRIGRRKTWMVPTQYLIGAFMLLLSSHVDLWLGADGNEPNIGILTALFFSLNFLAATQDIAVDGWALTMLKKSNVGHASTCNSVGQTAGFFLSYVLFMALESADFCNSYLRTEPENEGIVTLAGFLYFWGWIFLITTTVVAFLKKEEHRDEDNSEDNRDLKKAYSSLLQILKLQPVQTLVLILLTAKIGFSATDSVMTLKLVEAGIPKERLGLLAVPLIPLQIALPLVIAKYTTGPKPLKVYTKAIPYRLMFGFVAALLVWITPKLVPDASEGLPVYYYALLLICYSLHQVCVYSMFVSCMAFFAKISDPLVGGTYMTLLNTVTNLGGNWPATLSLWLVDPLTYRECVGGVNNDDNLCRTSLEKELCAKNEGKCSIWLDGYYVETVVCAAIGCLWLRWARSRIQKIQSLDEDAWRLSKQTK
ncbi:PREDICTED: acetyl-coenzyme A transporter 1 [Nicrophorus vespilloides]|uniref:Acetyl-coenzyme A transporter 1 n=1 Tax=Nicrophorus vespilloides TaxID=110193 RepID=A0ABM1MUF2_NICVS|nr:PREDICTED: acetyl-coenzyme A transporter 1 [Nicrophorus vespilloides]XP_017778203.1 PREDICTED: acetyl-coenzyme A transporter 1 [Nicrophorus vespilloides]